MKLFLVVRADLSPAQQAVQAAHALREFQEAHPDVDRLWYTQSRTLALLNTTDEHSLHGLTEKAAMLGLPFAPFHEPDRSNELTAVAFGPECKRFLARLPLALRV